MSLVKDLCLGCNTEVKGTTYYSQACREAFQKNVDSCYKANLTRDDNTLLNSLPNLPPAFPFHAFRRQPQNVASRSGQVKQPPTFKEQCLDQPVSNQVQPSTLKSREEVKISNKDRLQLKAYAQSFDQSRVSRRSSNSLRTPYGACTHQKRQPNY